MENRIARELLVYTLHEISAVVSLNEAGGVLAVRLFDTAYMADYMDIAPGAEQVMLICNHSGGGTAPTNRELANYERLKRMACGIRTRMFLSSEYFACREVG